MKKKLFFIIIIPLLSFSVNAQLIVDNPAANEVQAKTRPANLLVQLTNVLKTDSYLASFKKNRNDFLKEASNTGTSQEMVTNLTTLIKFIKADKFKNDQVQPTLLKTATTTHSNVDALKLLGNLESSLKSSAFNSIWKLQRKTWIDDLNTEYKVSK